MDNNNEFIHEDEQEPQGSEPARSRTVSPVRGFYWLERSLSEIYVPHFKHWFIAALVYTIITSVIPAFLPSLSIVMAIINPLLIAGLLVGAHKVYTQQGAIKPAQIFEAFQHPKIAQVVLYAVIAILLAIIMMSILASMVGMENLKGIDLARIEAGDEAYARSVFELIAPAIPWAVLLLILFSLATWFAISLILFSDQKAFPAIANSFIGGLKNFFAVLILAIVGLICIIVIAFIGTLVLSIFGSLLTNPYINLLIDALVTTLAVPIGVGTTYIAYREIFLGDISKSEKSL
ncbi:BPSS1780 family membrane protein [Kangiella shandongensis]|uniref:BPSS1780 family membrane protein n=1 Tax=Kangiella shandongensis TaxID=2763258 RepID=UPI001CBC4858|nr:BPSS1780 family membrane protein [Kangiella shandongensis]